MSNAYILCARFAGVGRQSAATALNRSGSLWVRGSFSCFSSASSGGKKPDAKSASATSALPSAKDILANDEHRIADRELEARKEGSQISFNSSSLPYELQHIVLHAVDAKLSDKEEEGSKQPQPGASEFMSIKAVHFARRIDILKVFQKLYSTSTVHMNKNSVVVRISSTAKHTERELSRRAPAPIVLGAPAKRSSEAYAVYFDYGACVFFNCDDLVISALKAEARSISTGIFDMMKHEEHLDVISCPDSKEWCKLEDNKLMLQSFDLNCIKTVAGVLGQTVALMYYEHAVDSILEQFQSLNATVEEHGTGSAISLRPLSKSNEDLHKKKLFQLVASNNTILTDVITKLKLIDRKRPGDAEWDYRKYHLVWELLSNEFELPERFKNLDYKLDLIQHNAKFFLELLGARKSERLEWYIIFLITAELMVSLWDKLL